MSILIAVPLAVLAATRRDRVADHVVRAVPLVGLGFPPFWVGLMLLLVFALHLGQLFPVGEYGDGGFLDHLHHMILPALTVALAISPILIRSLRAALLEVLDVRLHHDRAVQGRLRAPRPAGATVCATRSARRSPCSASRSPIWSAAPWSSRRCSTSAAPGS